MAKMTRADFAAYRHRAVHKLMDLNAECKTDPMTDADRNPAAVALGRLGGLAKTDKPKGFEALSKSRRRKIAQSGGIASQRNRKKNKK
jgi:hypothetical protein